MLLKAIAIAFVVGSVARGLFPGSWKGFGAWFKRFIDLTLVLLVLVFGTQLVLLALQ